MKMNFIVSILVLLLFTETQAQGLGEWFNQKATQKEYLLQQIAALKVYTGYARKGYDIFRDGSQLIGDLKKGDLSLHDSYFNSLSAVNPVVRSDPRVRDILNLQRQIAGISQQSNLRMTDAAELQEEELAYIRRVYDRVMADSDHILLELEQAVTNGKTQLSDDERIGRIGSLHSETLSQLRFVRSFAAEAAGIIAARAKEQQEINTNRRLHGIN